MLGSSEFAAIAEMPLAEFGSGPISSPLVALKVLVPCDLRLLRQHPPLPELKERVHQMEYGPADGDRQSGRRSRGT